MDRERRDRERRADPEDVRAEHARWLLRLRHEGERILLEPLRSRLAWIQTPEVVQDLCIARIAAQLPSSWRHLETATWSCEVLTHASLGRGLTRPILIERQHRLPCFIHEPTRLRFVLIPGGKLPGTQVRIAPMLVARGPVTEAQWAKAPGDEAAPPQVGVSPVEVRSWVRPHGMRLPSLAEWEHACRAGTQTRYFWGDAPNHERAWSRANARAPQPPERHLASGAWNSFGLVDTIGNVLEWIDAPPRPGLLAAVGLSFRHDLSVAAHLPMRSRRARRADTGFRPVFDLPEPFDPPERGLRARP